MVRAFFIAAPRSFPVRQHGDVRNRLLENLGSPECHFTMPPILLSPKSLTGQPCKYIPEMWKIRVTSE
jgi:hypothetical protein